MPEARPPAPTPVEVDVAGVEEVGAYRLLRLADLPEHLRDAPPGSFAMARDPRGSSYLPRPVGILDLGGGHGGVLVDPAFAVGALARARSLLLLGPLGRPFDLRGATADDTLLVAGGIGITVLPGIPARLGGRPPLLAGFRLPAQAPAAGLVPTDVEVVLAPALVTTPLAARLHDADRRPGRVLASGPTPMARAVAAACAEAGVPCQVAVEAPMACGFGACHGCAVPLDGGWARLCLEGPVLDGERLLRG